MQYFKETNKLNDDTIEQVFKLNKSFTNFDTVESIKYDIFQIYLYERLKDSIKIDEEFVIKLCKNFKGIKAINVYNDYRLNIIYDKPFSINNENFISFCNFFNYYIINDKEHTINNYRILSLEARKPKDITVLSLPCAYHITKRTKLDHILNTGLIPKYCSKISNKKDDYQNPTHVYAFQHNISRKDLLMYSKLLGISNKELVVIKINTKKFAADHRCPLKFYGDPSTEGFPAMFTEEPIPAKYLTKINIKEIEI